MKLKRTSQKPNIVFLQIKATDDEIIALVIVKLSYISNWYTKIGKRKQNISGATDLDAKL